MQINKSEMQELAGMIANAVVEALEHGKYVHKKDVVNHDTPYKKTEKLLYNYLGFKRIVQEKMQEIDDLRKYGVPEKSVSIVEYSPKSGTPVVRTVEETVDAAIANVQRSVEGTVQAIALIDKCMDALKSDPYYKILEMRYFEGRTQEDIALEFGVTQVTISTNKSRLVKALAMRLFPDQVIGEMLA